MIGKLFLDLPFKVKGLNFNRKVCKEKAKDKGGEKIFYMGRQKIKIILYLQAQLGSESRSLLVSGCSAAW